MCTKWSIAATTASCPWRAALRKGSAHATASRSCRFLDRLDTNADGHENPIPTIYVNKIYEVQKYLSLTNHVYEPMPVVVSELFWRGLDDGERGMVQDAVRRSQEHNRRLVSSRTVEMLKRLEEEGMVVSRPDRRPFAEAAARVPDRFSDTIGDELIEAAFQFVEDHRESRAREHPADQ